jgi:hypothetical protein
VYLNKNDVLALTHLSRESLVSMRSRRELLRARAIFRLKLATIEVWFGIEGIQVRVAGMAR